MKRVAAIKIGISGVALITLLLFFYLLHTYLNSYNFFRSKIESSTIADESDPDYGTSRQVHQAINSGKADYVIRMVTDNEIPGNKRIIILRQVISDNIDLSQEESSRLLENVMRNYKAMPTSENEDIVLKVVDNLGGVFHVPDVATVRSISVDKSIQSDLIRSSATASFLRLTSLGSKEDILKYYNDLDSPRCRRVLMHFSSDQFNFVVPDQYDHELKDFESWLKKDRQDE